MVLDRVYWHPIREDSEWLGVWGRPVKVKSVLLRTHHLIVWNRMINWIHYNFKHLKRRLKWTSLFIFYVGVVFMHINVGGTFFKRGLAKPTNTFLRCPFLPPPPGSRTYDYNNNYFILTFLASFPICPSQVSWITVDIGNRRSGVSVRSPGILTLGISITLGLTER